MAQFLILNPAMPRSLIYCYNWITRSLNDLASDYGARTDCNDIAERTLRKLAGADMEAIFQSGLHEFLVDFIMDNNRLTSEIANAYNFQ